MVEPYVIAADIYGRRKFNRKEAGLGIQEQVLGFIKIGIEEILGLKNKT